MSQDRVPVVQRKIGAGRRASAAGGGSGTTSYQMSATPKVCYSEDVRDLAETVDELCNNEVWFNYTQTSAFFGSIFGNPTSRESKIIHLDLYLEYIEARYPSLVSSEIRQMDSVFHELYFTQQTGHAPTSRATLVVISNLCQSRLFLCHFCGGLFGFQSDTSRI